MFTVSELEAFSKWLEGLRDKRGAGVIASRIHRLSLGNKGNVESVGEGVSELKVNFGPGYRVYFVERGGSLIILLCGGDKSSQGGTSPWLRSWRGRWIDNGKGPNI